MLPHFALARLEAAVIEGCSAEDDWPAQVSGGIYAGIDFAIANPDVVEWLTFDRSGGCSLDRYQAAISSLSALLRERAPIDKGLPKVTGEAVIGGVVGLVGEQLRLGRADRLRELRPEFVLLTLLPYMGFEEARNWANRAAAERL